MSHPGLGAFPEPHRDAVRAVLAEVCGTAPIENVVSISGGASGAFPYRVDAGGRRYLVRLEGIPSPLRNPQQYVSLRMAAEAGVAPRVYCVDEAARIAVTDFVAEQPLQRYPGGEVALGQALGEMLLRLHNSPAFPAFVNYPYIVARLFAHVRRTGLFESGLLDAHVERLAMLTEAYAEGAAALVASHNDLTPSNVLFDGERLWLVDWESAYRNDPLVDIAIGLDSFEFSPRAATVFVRAAIGTSAGKEIDARLSIVRALTRLYYAGVFLSASAAAGRAAADGDLSVPTVAEFEQSLREGALKPGSPAAKHALGKMYLASFMTGIRAPGFGAAV